MRLSEAIRLGAMISPQTRGRFFEQAVSEEGPVVATCALGAAALAAGGTDTNFACLGYGVKWPVLALNVPTAELPRGVKFFLRPLRVSEVIILLNDQHGWTRTEIAGWVEEFEQRHLAELEPEPDTARLFEPVAPSADDPEEESVVPALL